MKRWRYAWLVALCAAAVEAQAQVPDWPDNFATRVQALALLQTLNADLLSHDSATLTLERWCDTHHLAAPASITIQRLPGPDKPADTALRKLLQVGPTEVIRYRRVRLLCGAVELSDADNWYVPSRLTAQMNHELTSTDTPFGKVVRPLNFQRHTIAATLLWLPLPPGWEMETPAVQGESVQLTIPAAVLEHRALLALPTGVPISEVVETYTRNVLAFAPPATRAPSAQQ
jgi:hypothetical protein